MSNFSGMSHQFIFFGIIFVAMYFFVIRPQNKKEAAQKQMLAELNVGQEVILSGGILGKISKVMDDFIGVELAEGLEIKAKKQAVSILLPKGTLKKIC